MNSIVIVISANVEWKEVLARFPSAELQSSPYGNWFEASLGDRRSVIFHGGWGKMAAAGSTQYVIDRWNPQVILNIGTCGGFQGAIERGAVILAERTIVYDIMEEMGDPAQAIADMSTTVDLSWLGTNYPSKVLPSLLVSADRDLQPTDIEMLASRYGAIAGDWESGAIAYVSARNSRHCVILKGVSDLVGEDGGEAYGKGHVFENGATSVMAELLEALPAWINHCETCLAKLKLQ